MIDTAILAHEFPDFDLSSLPAIPAGFADCSWHNDVCPRFMNTDTGVAIWVDYANPTDREYTDAKRFTVEQLVWDGDDWQIMGDIQIATDSWADVLQAL